MIAIPLDLKVPLVKDRVRFFESCLASLYNQCTEDVVLGDIDLAVAGLERMSSCREKREGKSQYSAPFFWFVMLPYTTSTRLLCCTS